MDQSTCSSWTRGRDFQDPPTTDDDLIAGIDLPHGLALESWDVLLS